MGTNARAPRQPFWRCASPCERRRSFEIGQLNLDFADILVGGEIIQTAALPEEQNEPEIAALPRLVLAPIRKNFDRIRQLIDAINAAES